MMPSAVRSFGLAAIKVIHKEVKQISPIFYDVCT